jgi:hypothetical protein
MAAPQQQQQQQQQEIDLSTLSVPQLEQLKKSLEKVRRRREAGQGRRAVGGRAGRW